MTELWLLCGTVVGLDVGPVVGLDTDDERHTYAATRSRVSGEPGILQAFMPMPDTDEVDCCTDCRVYLVDTEGWSEEEKKTALKPLKKTKLSAYWANNERQMARYNFFWLFF